VADMVPLRANSGLASMGVKLHGTGFVLSAHETAKLKQTETHVIKPYICGRDLVQEARAQFVIDLFGLAEAEVRTKYPAIYQHVLLHVKPERDSKAGTPDGAGYAKLWWVFGKPRQELRRALAGLHQVVVTTRTAKHRIFLFQPASTVFESEVVVVPVDDGFFLGVLSSRLHVAYSLIAGGTLEDRPRYNNSVCFDPYPFPACDAAAQERVRKIAEELDAHRKRVQSENPGLTLTGMYNVLEKLRANEALNPKEKQIHDAGLVSVLRQLHDDLDAAVFAAYGWPPTLTDAEILERLVALNAERAKEEASGLVRWLRPDYQNPGGAQPRQTALAVEVEPKAKPGNQRAGKLAWPKTLSERVKAVSTALTAVKEPVTATELARRFARARVADVGEILETLCAIGKARRGQTEGTFLP